MAGERYIHHRTRQAYEMVGEGLDTDHETVVCIYRPLYPCEYDFFTRKRDEFFGTVEVDGKMIKRFEPVSDQEQKS